VTEPVAPLIPHLVYSAAGKLSLKQAPNGGCIIGGGWPAAIRDRRHAGHRSGEPRRQHGRGHRCRAGDGQVRALRSWTAWVNGTPDWRPILGEARRARLLSGAVPLGRLQRRTDDRRVTADLVLGQRRRSRLKGISVLAD
jgi:sarcosine oxidase subunit beta